MALDAHERHYNNMTKCNISAKQKEASDKATHNALNGALKTGAGPILNQMANHAQAIVNQAAPVMQAIPLPPPIGMSKKHDIINHYLGEGLSDDAVVSALASQGFKIKVADVNANIKHYGTDKIPGTYPKADLIAAQIKATAAITQAQTVLIKTLPFEPEVAQAMAGAGKISASSLITAAQKVGASKAQTFDLLQKAENDGLFFVPSNVDELVATTFQSLEQKLIGLSAKQTVGASDSIGSLTDIKSAPWIAENAQALGATAQEAFELAKKSGATTYLDDADIAQQIESVYGEGALRASNATFEQYIIDKYTTTGDIADVLTSTVIKEVKALGGTKADALSLVEKQYQTFAWQHKAEIEATVTKWWDKAASKVIVQEPISTLPITQTKDLDQIGKDILASYGDKSITSLSHLSVSELVDQAVTLYSLSPDDVFKLALKTGASESAIKNVIKKSFGLSDYVPPTLVTAPTTQTKIVKDSKDKKHDLIYKLRKIGYTGEQVVAEMNVLGYKIKLTDVNANVKHYGTQKIPMSPHVSAQVQGATSILDSLPQATAVATDTFTGSTAKEQAFAFAKNNANKAVITQIVDKQYLAVDMPPPVILTGVDPIQAIKWYQKYYPTLTAHEISGALNSIKIQQKAHFSAITPDTIQDVLSNVTPLTAIRQGFVEGSSASRALAQQEAGKKVQHDEMSAFQMYTGFGHQGLNKTLRQGLSDLASYRTVVQHLDAVLHRLTVPNNVVTWRGIGNASPLGKMRVDDLRRLVGTRIDDAGYISTSTSRNIASNFGSSVMLRIHVPKGTRGVYVQNTSMSSHHENELILPRGTQFTVTGVSRDRGTTIVDVDVAAQPKTVSATVTETATTLDSDGWQIKAPFKSLDTLKTELYNKFNLPTYQLTDEQIEKGAKILGWSKVQYNTLKKHLKGNAN